MFEHVDVLPHLSNKDFINKSCLFYLLLVYLNILVEKNYNFLYNNVLGI